MLTKETISTVEVLEDGALSVREATYILEDGVRISGPTYQRSSLRPGDATAGKTARIAAVADAVWTPEVLAAEEVKKESEGGKGA